MLIFKKKTTHTIYYILYILVTYFLKPVLYGLIHNFQYLSMIILSKHIEVNLKKNDLKKELGLYVSV